MPPNQKLKTQIKTPKDKNLQELLLIPCETKAELHRWFKTYLDVDLADQTVSRFATTNPMDAAWEIYSFAIHNKDYDPLNILLVASRASQKTLSMAAVELAVMLHDRREVLHYAAAETQAKVGWKYLTEFSTRPFIRDYLETKPTNNNLFFNLPLYTNLDQEPLKITAAVLPITLLNAQGQHSSFMMVDEILTLANDKRKAYHDLAGVPISTKDGRPYIRAEISSRKGPYSLVEQNIKEKDKTGLIVKTWTVLENQQRCPDSRSGVIPTIFYGNPKTGMALSVDQYVQLGDVEKSGYHKGLGGENCIDCKLAYFCLGDAKKQQSKCKNLNPVEKTLTDHRVTSLDLWLSQRMSMQPSHAGLVFKTFNKEKHCKNIKEIWEIFTQKQIDYVPTFSKLVEMMRANGTTFYCGIDHSGGTAPYAIVSIGIDKLNRIFVLNVFGKTVDFDTMEAELKKLCEIFNYRWIYPDPASKDKNDLLRKHKFRIHDKFTKDIALGIDLVRTKLSSAEGQETIWFLNEQTAFIQDEFGKYHFVENSDGTFADEPDDDFNHSIDALRYILQNILMTNGDWIIPDLSAQEQQSMQEAKDPHELFNMWVKQHIQEKLEEITDPDAIGQGDSMMWFDL